MRRRFVLTVAASLLGAGALALPIGLLSAGSSSAEMGKESPTFGTIPERAFTQTGIDVEQLPDLIAVANPDGSEDPVGYARKTDMFPGEYGNAELAAQEYRLIPVYDRSGQVLLGNVYPDYGFVPLDVSAANGFDIDSLIRTKTTVSEQAPLP